MLDYRRKGSRRGARSRDTLAIGDPRWLKSPNRYLQCRQPVCAGKPARMRARDARARDLPRGKTAGPRQPPGPGKILPRPRRADFDWGV